MKKLTIFIFLIVFISCKTSDKIESDQIEVHHKSSALNPELYATLLAFQAKVKIPKIVSKEISPGVKSIKAALIYVYEIKFDIENKDTIVGLTLSSDGINSYYSSSMPNNEKIYGIYQDACLKPTYINDPYKIGKYFIKEYIEDVDAIDKFEQKVDFINDAIYDVYLYKVRGKKLVFDKVLVGNKH